MSKYRARKTEIDGIVFDSAKESRRYAELKLLAAAGEIHSLRLQPRFELEAKRYIDGKLQRAIVYVADFAYKIGTYEIIEDVKGCKTQVYKIKRKLLLARYPGIDHREV